jgi:hypothetical protein
MGSAGAADAAAVLAPVNVANPMLAVLNAPVAALQRKQLGRIGAVRREAGDGVLHLAGFLAVAVRGAVELQDLSQAWPLRLKKRSNASTGLQMTPRASPVPFLRSRRLGELRGALTLTGGGKIPAENRRRSPPSAPADCL